MTGSVHVIVPEGIDDPRRSSGGNIYDRKLARGLADLGWQVQVHEVAGPWPKPDATALARLADALATLPVHGVVLIDGLVAAAASSVVVPASDRLRVVPLIHLVLGMANADPVPDGIDVSEHEVLESAAAVVATSRWTRRHLLDAYGLWPGKVYVAEPGTDPAPEATGTEKGTELLVVAAVVPHKGHDLMVEALGPVADLPWTVTCAGSLGRDPQFSQRVQDLADAEGIADRIRWVGVLDDAQLAGTYGSADLIVVSSRTESYGMVITEALARGIPVVAFDVGGVRESFGTTDTGRPGMLVPAGDVAALADALRTWLTDHGLRDRLRQAARHRRSDLRPWSWTAERVDQVLTQVGG